MLAYGNILSLEGRNSYTIETIENMKSNREDYIKSSFFYADINIENNFNFAIIII